MINNSATVAFFGHTGEDAAALVRPGFDGFDELPQMAYAALMSAAQSMTMDELTTHYAETFEKSMVAFSA